MKLTVNVNIGGVPFVVDQDAYTMISSYLSQIESRLSPAERAEIMEDVENRIAAIFSERLGVRMQVVSVAMVNQAIAVIGNADDFGEAQSTAQEPRSSTQANRQSANNNLPRDRFYRSRKDKMLGGICGALAPVMGIDATLIRLAVVLLTFLTFSTAFWIYIISWIIIPEEPTTSDNQNNECR